MDTARLAVKLQRRGIVGIDLSGEESGHAELLGMSSETTCA